MVFIHSDPLVDFHGDSSPALSGLAVGELQTRVLLGIPRGDSELPPRVSGLLLGQVGGPPEIRLVVLAAVKRSGFPRDCTSQPVLPGHFPLRRVGTGNGPVAALLVQRHGWLFLGSYTVPGPSSEGTSPFSGWDHAGWPASSYTYSHTGITTYGNLPVKCHCSLKPRLNLPPVLIPLSLSRLSP